MNEDNFYITLGLFRFKRWVERFLCTNINNLKSQKHIPHTQYEFLALTTKSSFRTKFHQNFSISSNFIKI